MRSSLKNVCRLLNTVQQDIPVEQRFLADLKRSIELTDKKEARKPSQTYKPSSMNCLRQMYYQVIGVEYEESSNYCLIGICESGSDRHERIQTAISKMVSNGIDCHYMDVAKFVKSRELNDIEVVSKQGMETKLFHKKLNMSFLCDGIIRYNGKYYITEFKTESLYKWQARKGVAEEHYNQAVAYSTAFGIDEVIFVYINRDSTDMKCYLYTVTGDMKQDFIGRIEMCNSYVENHNVPPKEETTPKKTCEYCNYKEQCRKDG